MSASPESSAALELVFRGAKENDEPAAYACPKCGVFFSPVSYGDGALGYKVARDQAERHCTRKCSCGEPLDPSRAVCVTCRGKEQAISDSKRFKEATKLQESEYEGPVYWEGHAGSFGDGYFSGVDEVREYCQDKNIASPIFVWTCSSKTLKMDVEQVLYAAFEDHYEGARDFLEFEAEQELRTFLDSWCTKQGIRSYFVDFDKAVLLHDTSSNGVAKPLAS